MELTDAQKKVILVFKTRGSTMPLLNADQLFDKRVINNLLKRDILRKDNGQYLLVEYGKTPKQRKNNKRRSKSRECFCGCKDVTKGGRFMPGHDGRIRKKVLIFLKTGELQFDHERQDVMDYLQNVHWMEPKMWQRLNNA